MNESPVEQSRWQARWIVEIGPDSVMGITIDDHCFVVLSGTPGNWHPISGWVPVEVAEKLGDLARLHGDEIRETGTVR